MLKAKVELIRIGVLDMWVIVPQHAVRVERSWSRNARANASRREGICINRDGWTTGSSGSAGDIQIISNQLPYARPAAFDVLRHLAHRSPIVIDYAGSSTHHRPICYAISKPEVRTDIGVSVMSDAPSLIHDNMRWQSARR